MIEDWVIIWDFRLFSYLLYGNQEINSVLLAWKDQVKCSFRCYQTDEVPYINQWFYGFRSDGNLKCYTMRSYEKTHKVTELETNAELLFTQTWYVLWMIDFSDVNAFLVKCYEYILRLESRVIHIFRNKEVSRLISYLLSTSCQSLHLVVYIDFVYWVCLLFLIHHIYGSGLVNFFLNNFKCSRKLS